ncbi:MAG: hypothetical protein V4525_12520 [Pseudomonadota bacterium]
MTLNAERGELLVKVARRLFLSLILQLSLVVAAISGNISSSYTVPIIVIAAGFMGGFIGLQRRLKDLPIYDLRLIADSWIYTSLSPLVGGLMALLLYILFLSDLLAGELFPKFISDGHDSASAGFASLFNQHGENYKEYAKLIFWCFIAGFSERFVTDMINRFEGDATKNA